MKRPFRKVIERTLQLVILSIGLWAVVLAGSDFNSLIGGLEPSPHLDELGNSFQVAWQSDMEIVESENSDILLTVGEVKVVNRSNLVKTWEPYLVAPVEVFPDQNNLLEIVIMTWEDRGVIATNIEYSIYDPKTGELLWEKIRTVYIKGSEDAFEKLTGNH